MTRNLGAEFGQIVQEDTTFDGKMVSMIATVEIEKAGRIVVPKRLRGVSYPLLALALASLGSASSLHAAGPATQSITIDAAKVTGVITRLNDVDNGPLCQHGIVDLSRYYKQLGVRNVRLHDVPWSYDDVLDIEYIFPDWNADPDRAESYNFVQSDFYIKTITDLGINIIFRLGFSAEGITSTPHNIPPPSYDRWVAVAEHIVRHYNQGWANGPHANIKYWEIWNEPDGSGFWSGTPEQYYRLYEVTATALKKLDNSLYVGGPAIAGNQSFLEGFIKYARQRNLDIDFVSWHIYTRNPADVIDRGEMIHRMMAQYGYAGAQSILDEWNFGPLDWQPLFVDADATRTYFDSTQNATGAAFDAAFLMALEDAHVDIATFYTGTSAIWGLFTASGVPQKPYYAFLAFSDLLRSPNRLAQTSPTTSPVRVIAGIADDRQTIRIFISNPSNEAQALRFDLIGLPSDGPMEYRERLIDSQSDFVPVGGSVKIRDSTLEQNIGPHSVILLTISPQQNPG